jgi:chromosome partitioning protein
MTRVMAIANQKGGVGKTTTAINLGAALAAVGRRILLIDLDPQGNASTGLGIGQDRRERTTYDVLVDDAPLESAIVHTDIPGLDIAPADVELSGAETELAATARRSYRLRGALARMQERGGPTYDAVLIDCPPSLNFLTINALTAAHSVLIPVQCEFFALEGLSQLMRTIDLVSQSLNPDLEIEGVVLTMYDKRSRLSDQVADDVRKHFPDKVYETIVPRNVRLAEAPSFGKPAIVYDHECAGSRAYLKLARELLKRETAEAAA